MITHVRIQNFRSFLDAEVDLEPFSLVVGANGSGKTNLLRFFEVVTVPPKDVATGVSSTYAVGCPGREWRKHGNQQEAAASFAINFSDDTLCEGDVAEGPSTPRVSREMCLWAFESPIFNLRADDVVAIEAIQPGPKIGPTGKGTTQVLDMLKNGDQEDLFDRIEARFMRYVPEVEKLSLKTVKEGFKQIQVREKGLKEPTPGPELSEGTRLILAMLTIIHQEKPPAIILLEDIDRGMHPRLFEYIAPMMRDMAVEHGINILATTHNPYLVDAFQENKKAVIIVEKKDGLSTLTTLDKRLEGLDYETENPEDMPLGALWYSGIVGGTPAKIGHGAGV